MYLYSLSHTFSAQGLKLQKVCAASWLSLTFWTIFLETVFMGPFVTLLEASLPERIAFCCDRRRVWQSCHNRFQSLWVFFSSICFIPRELFQLTSAGLIAAVLGQRGELLWSSSIWFCRCGAQRAGHCQGSAAHKSGLPWWHLLPSTVTECSQTDPKSPVPPVLRVSENSDPILYRAKSSFFFPIGCLRLYLAGQMKTNNSL